MSQFVPVLIEHRPVPKVWGGTRLSTVLGIESPPGETIGESWLLFDRPEGSSSVAGGGETLRAMMRRDPEALLGKSVRAGYGGRFPLLLKFIDAKERLSLQVHPDDAAATADGDSGKNESCVVIDAGPEARFVRGLQPGITRERFAAAVAGGGVEELVHSFTPKAGDCIDIPTGTVHSIGPDVLVFEVEQNSEVTYRIFDWGRPRAVQVDKAMGAVRYDNSGERQVVEPLPLVDGGQLLVDNPWFRLRRYQLDAKQSLATDGRFLTVTAVGGQGILGWRTGDAEPLRFRAGDTILVPACIDEIFLSPHGRLELLVCGPGRTR